MFSYISRGEVLTFSDFDHCFNSARKELTPFNQRIEIWAKHNWEENERQLTTLIYTKPRPKII